MNFTSFKLFLQVSFDGEYGETITQNGFLYNMPLDGVCFDILRRAIFYITLTYKRDTVFFISISVISKFTELSVYLILIYIHLFISHYF